jgi:cyclophilin family peptidyl-prolyl cis-trans isomerase
MLTYIVLAVALAGSSAAPMAQRAATPAAAPNPVIVFETAKGTIEIELFAADAPKSTAHLLDLVRHNFYRGLRFHRVESTLVQVGDPQSKNVAMEAYWGTGGSGTPIGAAEISRSHPHTRGAVGLAYGGGDPRFADSQFYIMKTASASLDGKYAVVGRVVAGMAVVDKIQKRDVVKNAYVKGEGRK